MAPGRVIRATRNGLGSFRLLGYYFGHYRGHAYLVPVGLLFLLIGLLPIPSRCSPIHCREVVDKGSGSSMKLRMLGVMDVRCRSVLPGIPLRLPYSPNAPRSNRTRHCPQRFLPHHVRFLSDDGPERNPAERLRQRLPMSLKGETPKTLQPMRLEGADTRIRLTSAVTQRVRSILLCLEICTFPRIGRPGHN